MYKQQTFLREGRTRAEKITIGTCIPPPEPAGIPFLSSLCYLLPTGLSGLQAELDRCLIDGSATNIYEASSYFLYFISGQNSVVCCFYPCFLNKLKTLRNYLSIFMRIIKRSTKGNYHDLLKQSSVHRFLLLYVLSCLMCLSAVNKILKIFFVIFCSSIFFCLIIESTDTLENTIIIYRKT